jgi:hypothetical protein
MTSPFMYFYSKEDSYMEFARNNNAFNLIPGFKYLPKVTWGDVAEALLSTDIGQATTRALTSVKEFTENTGKF